MFSFHISIFPFEFSAACFFPTCNSILSRYSIFTYSQIALHFFRLFFYCTSLFLPISFSRYIFFFFVRSLLRRNFLIFLSLMYRFLAQTKDKEVEISICSEYIINIFPWIKFIFLKVVLLLKILKIFQLCFVSSERIQKKKKM